jgi:hypothetical protein
MLLSIRKQAFVLAVFVALTGCAKRPADLPDGLAGMRAAITAHNYAEASTLARAEANSHAKDPAAQFELARAEALQNNEGRALDALETAVALGLPDASRALDDAAFATLAATDRFATLRHRVAPSPTPAALAVSNGAGRVEIREEAGGTHIQAGDVHLDTNF